MKKFSKLKKAPESSAPKIQIPKFRYIISEKLF